MNGLRIHEDSIVVVESIVANCLENGLPHRQDRQIIKAVSDFMISSQIFLLPGLLDIGYQLAEEINLSRYDEKYFNWDVYDSLHEYSNSVVLPTSENVQSIFGSLIIPPL